MTFTTERNSGHTYVRSIRGSLEVFGSLCHVSPRVGGCVLYVGQNLGIPSGNPESTEARTPERSTGDSGGATAGTPSTRRTRKRLAISGDWRGRSSSITKVFRSVKNPSRTIQV
jgi:hypothetical protein